MSYLPKPRHFDPLTECLPYEYRVQHHRVASHDHCEQEYALLPALSFVLMEPAMMVAEYKSITRHRRTNSRGQRQYIEKYAPIAARLELIPTITQSLAIIDPNATVTSALFVRYNTTRQGMSQAKRRENACIVMEAAVCYLASEHERLLCEGDEVEAEKLLKLADEIEAIRAEFSVIRFPKIGYGSW